MLSSWMPLVLRTRLTKPFGTEWKPSGALVTSVDPPIRTCCVRQSEDAMRAELNLSLLDKENLVEQMKELRGRAEAG